MYSFQGLWTAAHYGLGVVFVICNNSSYRILKERTYALQGFSAKADSYIAMDLEQPPIDFVGLAQSLGVPGKHAKGAEELKQALTRALAQEGPVLIDVALDRSFKS
jgi:benzoylformate decarboxylase